MCKYRFIKYFTKASLFTFASIVMLASCDKNEENLNNTGFRVEWSGDLSMDDISSIQPDIDGGFDTLKIHTSKKFDISFESSDLEDWVHIEKVEEMSSNLSVVVLKVKPLQNTFEIRSGVLSMTTDDLDGKFINVKQGYTKRFNDDFNWLRYGVLNPLDDSREVSIKNWTVAQSSNGWSSTVGDSQEEAFVYGRFEHLKLGSEEYGANLISRNIGGIEKDSLLVLSFNAVAYSSDFEGDDQNKLLVELENGCTFMDGSTSILLDLGHYDAQSALLNTKFWDNSFQSLYIQKPNNNVLISTIRVKFTTAGDMSVPKNRVFLDNFSIYSVKEYFNKK